MKNIYDIIKRPVITEQSMADIADKKYVFMVDINSNKGEIKEAVETAFGVKVAKVNTVRMQGKVKRTGAYPAGKRADYKKAIIQKKYNNDDQIAIMLNKDSGEEVDLMAYRKMQEWREWSSLVARKIISTL